MRAIISGGGTGGHVFPAIAIADALKRIEPEIELLFVGARGKLEMEKVPQAGYAIKGLWISGFQRKLSLKNLTFPVKLVHSLWKARQIIHAFKPDILVGVGGYASWPILHLGIRRGIPALIQEQNSFPGIANRMLAKRVNRICVAYENMERYFPVNKLVLTGNPVRKDIINIADKKKEAKSHFDLGQDKKTIFLFGGSLGARSLNEAVAENFAIIRNHTEIELIWQVGKLYYDQFSKLPVASLPNVQIKPFIDRMDLAYACADLVICRAGASTISELCVAAKAAIFVPSPNVAEDHQTKNAQALVEKNAGCIVSDLDAKTQLFKQAYDLLKLDEKRFEMEKKIQELAKPDADIKIAEEVLQLVK